MDLAYVQDLWHFLHWSKADLFSGIEVNVKWPQIPTHQHLPELFQSENAICTITANNTYENNWSIQQFGSVCSMALGVIVSCLNSQGADPTGLGWWVWQLFKGWDNTQTRIYMAYHSSNSSRHKLSSVIEQHHCYLCAAHRDDTCLQMAFVHNL